MPDPPQRIYQPTTEGPNSRPQGPNDRLPHVDESVYHRRHREYRTLSEDLRFLDQRSDIITSEAKDRTLKKVHFRECLYTNAWVTSNLVWAYDWNKTLARVSKLVSSTYRRKWKLSEDWGGIVYNWATTRSKRLEWGEIVAERLREEIVGVLDQDEVIVPYGKVKHLPYLRACFDESMRMFPPVLLHIPCRTPLEGTAAVRGEFVAGETSVQISTYVVHRNEAISLDPEAYKPERRLGETGGIYSRILLLSTRGYIGRNISYLVLQASLVHASNSLYHRRPGSHG
ncbi:hypothetical protein ETB97_004391 [Aspergillus alliaceus]|uniref:Uncharacterized protein n=1 Tax=Petromyces alliaceus TaxID=209559 RepID=A0A8H6E3V5_PETAA|nr:hypothetical protein ETB97_004391 [Aspergillus burnettii]